MKKLRHQKSSFENFELDERLLKVVRNFVFYISIFRPSLGWEHPAQLQEAIIQLALESKNYSAELDLIDTAIGPMGFPGIKKFSLQNRLLIFKFRKSC